LRQYKRWGETPQQFYLNSDFKITMSKNPLEEALALTVQEATKEQYATITARLDKLNTWIEKNLKEEIQTITIKGTTKGTVTGKLHEKLPILIEFVDMGFNVLLTGSTGSGKTTGAMQASKALGLKFDAISVGMQTSKSDILGFMNANGVYVSTAFRKCYEEGGLFIMDEIDAGNSNVLIVINSALSNGFCSFPDKQVPAHKNFRFVGTANTSGRGKDLHYVGRNVLDLATLDRFVTIQWEYSENIESALPTQLLAKVKQARQFIQDKQIDGFVSTRSAFSMSALVESGKTPQEAFEVVLYNKMPSIDYGALMSYLFSHE
jgi:cobaltochelatase CobS